MISDLNAKKVSWHDQLLDDIYQTLKSSENGLSSKEVTERNELPRGSGFCQRRS